jgi:hypothetical protein
MMWRLCSALNVPTNLQRAKTGGYVPCGPKNRGYVPGDYFENRRSVDMFLTAVFENRHEE